MKDKNIVKFLALETIIPLCIAFVIEILIFVIQNEVGEYCFIDGISCSNYWVRLWSFVR